MLDDARVTVMRGASGVAARFPGVVLFCVAGTSDDQVLARVIQHCRDASASGDPASQIGAAIATLLSDHRSTPPAFAVAARTDSGLAVLVRGSVEVEIHGLTGEATSIGGLGTLTWADRVLPAEFDRIMIRVVGVAPEAASPYADLVEGVVEASGVVLLSHDGRTAPAGADDDNATGALTAGPAMDRLMAGVAPAGGPLPVPSFDSFLLNERDHEHELDPVPEDAAEDLEPLPIVGGDERVPDAPPVVVTGDVLVAGTKCSRDHFNDPRSRFCGSCGIAMVHATWTPVSGPRPPLGVLVFEDGTTFSLSTSYVIGRQPEISSYVASGAAQPIVLEDPERVISRAQALIELRGWDATVRNLSNTNPTYVWSVAEDRWIALADEEPMTLSPGTRVGFGRRSVIFESARIAAA